MHSPVQDRVVFIGPGNSKVSDYQLSPARKKS